MLLLHSAEPARSTICLTAAAAAAAVAIGLRVRKRAADTAVCQPGRLPPSVLCKHMPVFFNLFVAAEPYRSVKITHGTPCSDP